jgi:hypothetical protein
MVGIENEATRRERQLPPGQVADDTSVRDGDRIPLPPSRGKRESMSLSKRFAEAVDYFNPADGNDPHIDFAGYCEWLDSLEPSEPEPTPIMAKSFDSLEAMLRDAGALCPVCGEPLEGDAAVCVHCLEDAFRVDDECTQCGEAGALPWSGMCGGCTATACEIEDDRLARVHAEQARW